MRKLIFLTIALTSCVIHAQRKPKIKGNKNVIEVREELPPFNAIELNDDLKIFLQKSSEEGYIINADDNLIDVLKFKVEDSILVISSFYNITAKKKLDIVIDYREITSITARDGKISMKDIISSDVLYVTTSGSAKLDLNASADIIDLTMDGNSSGDYNLASDSLNITLKDRVDARIYSTGVGNTINMYKNASVKMEGRTDVLTINLYENANLKGQKLEAGSIKLKMEGSPSARIYALDNFELSSSGSSKAYLYGGNPKIEILEFLDTSQLHKQKN